MTAPDDRPLASGQEADVYALDDARVLRRYRHGKDTAGEARVMTYLAGLGYPVPAVHAADGPDLIMERLDGPTMAQAMTDGRLDVTEGAHLLAGLLRRLHELPPWPGAAPGNAILHLDLHPENVLLTGRGPVVIDWCNATDGPADLDTGLSALILAQVVVAGVHPAAPAVEHGLRAFLKVAPGDPMRLLDDAVAFRRGQLSRDPGQARDLPAAAALLREMAG